MVSDICADCGKPIQPWTGSYATYNNGERRKAYHTECGDPLGLKAKGAEIDRLRAALAAAREVIEPFAKIAGDYAASDAISARHHRDEGRHRNPHPDGHRVSIALGDCRRARAFLERTAELSSKPTAALTPEEAKVAP